MTISQLFDLADPRIRKIWDEKDTQLSKTLEYKKLGFQDRKAETLNDKFENFTGLGLASATGEKEPYTREDIQQGYSVTLTPQKWTKANDISEEMLVYNLWGKINNVVGGIANSVNGRIDTEVAKMYYLGFGTTNFTGGDSKALFATDHPMGDGTTQSNSLGAVPLTYDNLKTAAQTLDTFYDDKGIRLMPSKRMTLIVSRWYRERAIEVLRSIGNPDNANRMTNVFNDGETAVQLVVSNWIPSGYKYYWFLIDQERASYMSAMNWGWRPKFDNDKAINNGSKIYTGSTAFKAGFWSWQFGVGSASTTA